MSLKGFNNVEENNQIQWKQDKYFPLKQSSKEKKKI